MTHADLYVRTSTTAAASGALARQEVDCQTLVTSRGWTPRLVHVDQGRSAYGSSPRQSGLAAAMVAAAAGLCDVLVVWRMDRLTRRGPAAMSSILTAFAEADVRVVSVMEAFDSTLPNAELRAEVLAQAAHVEAQALGMRVRSAHQYKKALGGWAAGALPYGFAYDPTSGDVRLDDEPAARLRLLIERVLGGASLVSTAGFANERAWPAPRGGLWGVTTLSQLLANPVIAGMQPQAVMTTRGTYSSRTVPQVHAVTGDPIRLGPALVSLEEWHELQRQIAGRRVGDAPRTPRAALVRWVHCVSCGAVTHVRGKAYTCSSVANGRPCPAPARAYVPAVDAAVRERLCDELRALEPAEAARRECLYALRGDPVRLAVVEALDDALRVERDPERLQEQRRRREQVLREVTPVKLVDVARGVAAGNLAEAAQRLLWRIDLAPGTGRGRRFEPTRLVLQWR